MSKLNVVRRCYNCGAILQSEDPEKEGFLESKLLDSSESTVLFCEHCWRQQRYNIAPREPTLEKDYLKLLDDARASDAMIVYVVDLFSFEASFIAKVTEKLRGLKLLIIANKRDLLPKNVSNDDLKEYVAHRFRVAKCSATANDVVLTSLTTGSDVRDISERIQKERAGHDVYIIGATGCGKSHFLAAFLKSYNNVSNRYVRTSNYPDTKIRVMQIPLDKSSMIFDTPGLSIDNSITGLVDLTSGKAEPEEMISERTTTLDIGESLFIGGLARIDLVGGKRTTIKSYFSRGVTLRKASKNNDRAFLQNIDRGLVKPTSRTARLLTDFDAFQIAVDESGSRDIGIQGLGWINFTGPGQTFQVYVPRGVSIYTSRAKIK